MPSKDEILQLEREFWTTMAAGEHNASAKLLAGQVAMVSGMGSLTFSPDEYVAMSGKSPFKITNWFMSDEDVIFPTPETAVWPPVVVGHTCSYRSNPRSRPRVSCCTICWVIF